MNDKLHPCVLTPGVKSRYVRPGRLPAWLIFCFECEELVAYEGPSKIAQKGFGDGIDPFAAVMKRIFPADPVIQGLKTSR